MVSRLGMAVLCAVFLAGCGQQHVQQATELRPSDPAAFGSMPVPGARLAVNSEPVAPAVTGEPANEQFTLPAGTRIRVALSETLDTKYCRPGQGFTARLEEPLVVGRRVVAPKGASLRGHVTTSKSSGRFKGRAVLGLSLDSISVDGSNYAIATNLTVRVSSSHKRRNLAIIGGGSGGGAAIGAIAGGGVGALIGAAAGAGAGTAGAFFTGRKNVVLPVETELTFSLRSPLAVRG